MLAATYLDELRRKYINDNTMKEKEDLHRNYFYAELKRQNESINRLFDEINTIRGNISDIETIRDYPPIARRGDMIRVGDKELVVLEYNFLMWECGNADRPAYKYRALCPADGITYTIDEEDVNS